MPSRFGCPSLRQRLLIAGDSHARHTRERPCAPRLTARNRPCLAFTCPPWPCWVELTTRAHRAQVVLGYAQLAEAALGDYTQCCAFYSSSQYDLFAIDPQVRVWNDYSQEQCYRVPAGNDLSAPAPEASWWLSQTHVDDMCQNYSTSRFGRGARCDVGRTARCYSASTSSSAYSTRRFCQCAPGYVDVGANSAETMNGCLYGTETCVDVDECNPTRYPGSLQIANDCAPLSQCVNTAGSFMCNCAAGYAEPAGWVGAPGVNCSACAAGKYKENVGQGLCQDCPVDSDSSPGAVALVNCSCKAGYTGTNGSACTACSPGEYKEVNGDSRCHVCPVAKYSPVAGSPVCSPCPRNSSSHPGSARLSACTCLPGYTGSDGQECIACPAGSAKAANGSRPCEICEAGKYSERAASTACSKCPDGAAGPMGSTSRRECACAAGFTRDTTSMDTLVCLPCEAGKFKATNGTEACADCEPGSYSLAEAKGCVFCPGGTYNGKTGSGSPDDCLSCPADGKVMSFPGSVSEKDCAFDPDVLKMVTSEECGTIKPVSSSSAPLRSGHVLMRVSVQDSQRVYLFGGYFLAERNDVWYFDIASSVWIQIRLGFGDLKPAARTEHSMVEMQDNLIVFGGRQGSSRWNDLWEFKTQFHEWVQLAADGNMDGPVARYGHSAVSIAGEMLVFGGQDANEQKRNDLWKWDSSGWSELTLSPRPAPRVGHRVARVGFNMFLFGGRDSSDSLRNDLWKYNSYVARWTQMEPANVPPPRHLHAMQGLGPIIIVHGGASESEGRNDLWQYDTYQNIWTEAFPGDNGGMERRELHQMVDVNGKMMIHGGAADLGVDGVQRYVVSDVWEFLPCICMVPGTVSVASSYKCSLCAQGKYKDWFGVGGCVDCPRNSTGPSGSSSKSNCICVPGFHADSEGDCEACKSGKFNLNGSMPCQNCPAGSISPGTGSTFCSECPAGTFSEADMGNGRAVCVRCPRNSTSKNGSKTVTDCKCIPGYSGNLICTPCAAGTYKVDEGPTACSPCPSETYSTVEGATSISKCKACPSRTSSDEGAEECECVAGFYPISQVDSVCAPCEPGTFKPGRGNEICAETCGLHETSAAGATSASDCFCSRGFTRALGLCTACEAGTYKSQDGDSVCQPCAEGTYSDETAATSCRSCPGAYDTSEQGSRDASSCVCKPGYFVLNSASCQPCIAGTFSASKGSRTCTACSAGSFSGGTASSSCISCPSNSTSEPGSTAAEDCQCLPGYTGGQGRDCTACAAGSFKNAFGSAPCEFCSMGKYSGPVSTACTECRADAFTTTLNNGSTSAADCKYCKPGYEGSSDQCTPCARGKYKSVIGSSPCIQCQPGSYQETLAATTCTLCESGTFSGKSGGDTKELCLSCPVGKSTAPGAVGLVECGCNPGSTGPSGDLGNCLLCEPGTSKSSIGPSECDKCPAGTYAQMAGLFSCVLCPGGTYLETEGNILPSSCWDCPDNSNSAAGSAHRDSCLCIPGYGVTLDGRCEACPPGTAKPSSGTANCTKCPPGSFTDPGLSSGNVGHTNCSLCPAGTFSPDQGASSSTVCRECSENSISSEGAMACACNQGYERVPFTVLQPDYICAACRGGFYKEVIGDEPCSPCAIGKFADEVGRTSCKACPSFSTTTDNQTERANDCVCMAGYTGRATNFAPCVPCQPGSYKSATGSSSCVKCGIGKYSDVSGGVSESVCNPCMDPFAWSPQGSTSFDDCVCDAGYYLPAGAIFCTSCQKGKYKPTYGDNSTCITCPSHSTTLDKQSSTLEQCLCLPGYTGEPSNLMPCSPCDPGYYKHVFGSAPCNACQAGKYLSAAGATTELQCQTCPDPNQWSQAGSTGVSDCVCGIGYALLDYAASCSACVPGFYKPNPGNMQCTQCAGGTYSPAAAHACISCPQHSYALQGSGLVTDCICNAGYTGLNGAPCTPCPPGTYKSVSGSISCSLCGMGKYSNASAALSETQCSQCPRNSTSHSGSEVIQDCLCDPGFMCVCDPRFSLCVCDPGFDSIRESSSVFSDNASPTIGFGGSCSMCPPGKFKSFHGSSACIDCDAGKYSGAVGGVSADGCISCPGNSLAPSGSVGFHDCRCFAGYTLSGVNCIPCAPGTYKAANGTEDCTKCPVGKFLDSNAATSESECIQCPLSSLSPEGSDSVSDCLCAGGYTGDPGLVGYIEDSRNRACNPCASGTYKSIPGASECLACAEGKYADVQGLVECKVCPVHSSSVARSTSIAECLCNAGYSGRNGICNACPAGTFKGTHGLEACTKCSVGKYSNQTGATAFSTCIECETGASSIEGSDVPGDCTCLPGFTGSGLVCHGCEAGKYKAANGSAPCDFCPAGKFSETVAAADRETCKDCPENSFSLQASNSPGDCTCNMGHSGLNGHACQECSAGKYKDWQGQGACVECPQYASASKASTSEAACECNAGYTANVSSRNFTSVTCRACPPGTFKLLPGLTACEFCPAGKYSVASAAVSADACFSCPENSVSNPGASFKGNCQCNAGYQRSVDDVCLPCAPGKYKSLVGEQFCIECPGNRTTAAGGGTNVSICVCNLGFSGANCARCPSGTYKDKIGPDPCMQCEAGKYSSIFGSTSEDVCARCPQHTWSRAGASGLRNCTCNSGFRTTGSGACEVCASGAFSIDGSSESCTQCGSGLYSSQGSSSANDCTLYSFSVQASIILNNMGTSQDFFAQEDHFMASIVDSINSEILNSKRAISVDDVAVMEVCDEIMCTDFFQRGSTPGPTAVGKQIRVEIQVRTVTVDESSALLSVISASTTLQNFEARFFDGDSTKNAAYFETPTMVSSADLPTPCGRWYSIMPTGATRSHHSMAEANGKIFSFGGLQNGVYRSDLRQFDPLSREWITMISDRSPAAPTPRIDTQLVGSVGSLLLFGGRDENSNYLMDLWRMNLLTWTWENIQDTGGASSWPSARYLHAVAADAQGGFFMFGGDGGGLLNDVWRWNAVSSSWIKLRADGNTDGPDGREGHSLAVVQSRIFMFGGLNRRGRNTNDLWEYVTANNTWVQHFDIGNDYGPSARHGHAMIGVNDSILLFGGQSGNAQLNDFWGFQPADLAWSRLQADGSATGPRARSFLAMASLQSKVIVYGGSGQVLSFGDTWEYAVCSCPAGAERQEGICTLCPTGTFKDRPGPQACTMCPAAKYSATIGATDGSTCLNCPVNSWSPPSSSSGLNCSCRAGYTRQNVTCVACSPGTFKATNGTDPCKACEKGSFSPSQASTFCTLCQEGKYGANLSTLRIDEAGSCLACPANSSSPAGASGPAHCVCNLGFSGLACQSGPTSECETSCAACPPGYYKDWKGEGACLTCAAGKFSSDTARYSDCVLCSAGKYSGSVGAADESMCQDCPSRSHSLPGASSLGACLCNPGYTGTNGACSACPSGTYKSFNGSSSCLDCPPGSYSTTNGSTFCQLCAAGKYSIATGSTADVCVLCPMNTMSEQGTGSVADCLCNAGYTGTGGICAVCSPGTFKDARGTGACVVCPNSTYWVGMGSGTRKEDVCQPCPPQTESLPGSSSAKNCTCIAGSERAQDGTCKLCPPGKFKGSGGGVCEDCPAGSWNVEGSINISQCQCGHGYHGPNGQKCTMCAAGTYKPVNGSSACIACDEGKYSTEVGALADSACLRCADGATSQRGSPSAASCLCTAGTQGNGVTQCIACEAGKYKSLLGTSACLNCQPGSTSPVGSTAADQCICGKGHTNNGPGSCTACIAGTYKPANGSQPCTACPAGKYGTASAAVDQSACLQCPQASFSGERSSSPQNCICNKGYTGPDGGPCSECTAGKYKPTDGSSLCTPCSEGKFGIVLGALTERSCQLCPNNSYTEAGANSSALCVCKSGFFQAAAGCISCPAGKYKDVTGNEQCTLCPQNTYGTQEAATSVSFCTNCPQGSKSNASSASISACLCDPGFFFRFDIVSCEACPVGTYKAEPGSQECTKCAADTYSGAVGATSQATCNNCPEFTSSHTGSEGIWKCLCKSGYTGTLGVCYACAQGTYKPTVGRNLCTKCPIGKWNNLEAQYAESSCNACVLGTTTLQEGSTRVTDCVCNLGFTNGGAAVACSPCDPGTYKNFPGPEHCTLCDAGKYSGLEAQVDESACQKCPAHTLTLQAKSTDLRDCLCGVGFTGNPADGIPCTRCPVGTCKGGVGTVPCELCRPGTYAGVLGQVRCDICPAGTYNPNTGSNSSMACKRCPEIMTNSQSWNLHSEAGSASIESCICNAGYTGPDGGPCVACTPGQFKASNGSTPCEGCHPGSWEHRSASTACTLCSPGKYSGAISQVTNTTCQECPKLTLSLAGSRSIYDCQCVPGTTGPDGGNCTACPPGFDKKVKGNGTCSPCSLGTYAAYPMTTSCQECPAFSSTAGLQSKRRDDCLCLPGYTGNISQNIECRACSPGTYKTVGGSDECLMCGLGKFSNISAATKETDCALCPDPHHWSPTGSGHISECVCTYGYTLVARVCQICVKGTFKPQPGDVDCTDCRPGTYSEVIGASTIDTCLTCPPNSESLARSDHRTDCECTPGFSGSNGGPCIGCPTGKFKESKGSSDCVSCPAGKFANTTNSTHCFSCVSGKYSAQVGARSELTCNDCPQKQTSPPASDEFSDCRCIPGFTGANGVSCSACLPGSFKDVVGDAACKLCAQGSYISFAAATACNECEEHQNTTGPGSTEHAECVCDAGYYALDGSCVICPRDQYKATISDSRCLICTNYSSSLPGSVSEQDCKCNMGYTGPDSGLCVACVPGTFKSVIGSSKCTNCSSDKYSEVAAGVVESQCLPCPANTTSMAGSGSQMKCKCNAGFTGQGGSLCSSCAPGKFKPTYGSEPCTNCSSGSYSEVVAAVTKDVCRACPLNSYSESGSSIKGCRCNVGYTGPGGEINCSACAVGKFKPTNGSDECDLCGAAQYLPKRGSVLEGECVPCPGNSTSNPGSGRLSQCLCLPGYTGLSDPGNCTACPRGSYKNVNGSSACVECEAGKYAPNPGTLDCTLCPNNSFSGHFSASITQCICNAGYTGSSGVCTACAPGTFKNISGPANCTLCNAGTYSNATSQVNITTCKSCPTNTFSDPGSDDLFDCFCSPGYTGNRTVCTPCAVGKYKAVGGSSQCIACIPGKYADVVGLDHCKSCNNDSQSLSGSVSAGNCTCNAGYTEKANTKCNQTIALNSNNSTNLTSTICVTAISCIPCNPGTYKSVSGSKPCTMCGRGKFLPFFASTQQTACEGCPMNSDSSNGSMSINDCLCNAGFTGVAGNCSACPAGTFKSVNGSAACNLCGSGKYSNKVASTKDLCLSCQQYSLSPPGSPDVSYCSCNAGFFGPNGNPPCTLCAAGKYQDQNGSSACKACPGNSTSSLGSKNSADCECVAGFYDINSTGAVHCKPCPVNHTSVRGSNNFSACVCNVGYTGQGGGTCTACRAGTYKDIAGTAPCIDCLTEFYQSQAGQSSCTKCPSEMHTTIGGGKSSVIACICKPGATNFGAPDGEECHPCPKDTYKSEPGSQNCTECPFPSTSVPGSDRFDDCQCQRGGVCFPCPTGFFRTYFVDAQGNYKTSCIACEPGKYSDTVGATEPTDCKLCPGNSNSKAGTASIMNCSCNIGYGGRWQGENLECAPCDIGYYKDWNGSSACAQCPARSSTMEKGSDEVEDCLCKVGFSGLYDACEPCDRGKYKNHLGSTPCTDCDRGKYGSAYGAYAESACIICPNHSISEPGSWNLSNCSCTAGFSGNDGGPCIACLPNTYKMLIGPSPCLACPLGSVSLSASTRLVDCQCNFGHYGENGTACTICERGKYKDTIGPMDCTLCASAKYSSNVGQVSKTACQECPANATSDPGSWQLKHCECNPGFWGKNGSNCTACNQQFFKTRAGEADDGLLTDCKPCPANSWSPFASPHCKCNVGYGGPDQSEFRDRDCVLCTTGKYKNWRGSAECEECHERIKPSRSAFVNPTAPLEACEWRCDAGFYYPDQQYFDSDELSWTRAVEVREPDWFAWYELEEYKATAPRVFYTDTRKYLPNTCERCTTSPPAKNPCGYGEFWAEDLCSTFQNNGCVPCENPIGDEARYVFPNPHWRIPQCPITCAVGYYNFRVDSSTVIVDSTGISDVLYPECRPCPHPSQAFDTNANIFSTAHVNGGQCPSSTGNTPLFYQCGFGMGYMGMDTPENLFTKVFNWDGKCYSSSQ